MKEKLQAILTVANDIHKYADNFKQFSEDIREDILMLGDKVAYLAKVVPGLTVDELEHQLEHLYYIYYNKHLLDKKIKFEEVIDTYFKGRELT